MAHLAYPGFSLECAQEIFRMLRGRTVRQEFKLFMKCQWMLQGGAYGVVPGEPDQVEPSFASGPECDEETARNVLAELKAVGDEGIPETFGAADENAEAIDPATIAIIIQLVTTLIQKWIERRKQN